MTYVFSISLHLLYLGLAFCFCLARPCLDIWSWLRILQVFVYFALQFFLREGKKKKEDKEIGKE